VTGPRAVLVVNVRSRSGAELFERAREALVRAGVVLAAAHAVEDGATLRRRVRAELRRGATVVLVGGGDGTIATAAGLLAGSDATLGVLPLGTANDFARTLGIPDDLAAACRVAARGAVRVVDVAFAGRRAFLNAATVGASSEATRRVNPALKRRAGALAYPLAGAAAAGQPPFHARLVADGAVRHDGPALQVVVGNGRYHGGGRLVAPGARPDDGALDVYVLSAPSGDDATGGGAGGRLRDVAALARYALLLLRGRHVEHPRVFHLRAREVTLRTEPRLEIHADGEVAGPTPGTFRVAPAALRVLAPRPRRPGRLAR
jgi:YegS/Rv2252/BmrU family lipid kinase